MKIRSAIATAGVTALVLSAGTAAAAEPTWPSGAPDAAHALDPAQQSQTIELITGDKVLLQPGGRYAFAPAEGRENVGHSSFSIKRDGTEERYVVPRDAVPLLSSGKLDRRLFNVTALARDGFADATSLPLIVQYEDGRSPAAELAGAERTAVLSGIDAAVYDVTAAEAEGVWAELTSANARALSYGYKHVWLDGKSKLLLDQSVPQVGAPTAWQAGYTGTGVTVAVLDTGYDPTHPDLNGRVTEAKDFTDSSPGAIDGYGHGTHVASTVAGTGAASNGKYKGVAPDAKLLVGKVCDDGGSCEDSDIIAGMQWAADQGATAVNLSLGGGPTDGTDPLSLAVNEISLASGTLFVIAAGNDGAAEMVSSPATADEALAVGSVTKSDELSDFSSQGPRFGDGAVKPDISAPGSDIVAARAKGTEGPAPVDEFYTGASGTSMATPHVAGAAALLKQAHPDWTARQLKSALMSSSKDLDGLTIYQEGAGRLDIGRGVSQDVTTDVGSLSFGKFAFPHGQPGVSKKVTYTNSSDAEVTLALSLAATAPDGSAAPAGVYAVDKTSVTIPAGGTAEATITFNPVAGSPMGAYSGVLTATGGDVVVRTAAGGVLEPEMHDLKVNVKQRTGTTEGEFAFFYFNVDTGEGDLVFSEPGAKSVTLRVEPGRYELLGSIDSYAPKETTTLVVSDLTVGHADVTTTLDATKGVREKLSLADRGDERLAMSALTAEATSHNGDAGYSYGSILEGSREGYLVANAAPTSMGFIYNNHSTFVSPDGAAKPYSYEANYVTRGKLPKGTTRNLKNSAFVLEKAVYHSQGVKAEGLRFNIPIIEGLFWSSAVGIGVKLPSTVQEYYMAGEWEWSSELDVGDFDNWDMDYETQSGPRNTPRTVDWFKAPLAPSVVGFGAYRYEDQLSVAVPMYSGAKNSIVSFNAVGVTGTTTLLKDGQVLGTSDTPCYGDFELPAGLSGKFTLKCETTRAVAWSKIGTASSGEWTFDSAPSADGELLKLSAVRLGATGVKDGFAAVGATQTVTLDVERSTEVNPGTKSLRFQVSYDEGKTWKSVTISRTGDHATATLKHPAGAKSVSVRLTTTDKTGHTAVHTTIKAYGLK